MTAHRPTCVNCGAAYGRRDTKLEVVRWRDGERKPEYNGNGIVVRDHYHGINPLKTVLLGVDCTNMHAAYRDVWDGETWVGGHKPFCTLRCALRYARRAYAERSL